VTNLLNLLDNVVNAPKDEQLVILVGSPLRSVTASLATEAIRQAGRTNSVFHLVKLHNGLFSSLSQSVQLAQITVVPGFQFRKGAIYSGVFLGEGAVEFEYALGKSAIRLQFFGAQPAHRPCGDYQADDGDDADGHHRRAEEVDHPVH